MSSESYLRLGDAAAAATAAAADDDDDDNDDIDAAAADEDDDYDDDNDYDDHDDYDGEYSAQKTIAILTMLSKHRVNQLLRLLALSLS